MSVFLLPALLGPPSVVFLAARLLWPVRQRSFALLALQASFAVGIGLGITSAGCFLWYGLVGPAGQTYRAVETSVLVLAGCVLGLALRHRHRHPEPGAAGESAPLPRLPVFLSGVLLAQAAVFLHAFTLLCVRDPHGDWDAYAFWNHRARMVFRGGISWTDAFSTLNSHPDYPLCLPAAVVRCWTYEGTESLLAPNLVGFLFSVALFVALVSALSLLRGATAGCLGGIILLSTRSFLWWGAAQYADVPLAFYFLATVVLLTLGNRMPRPGPLLLLAGATAGLAVWTKNEGLVFLPVVLLAYLIVSVRQRPPGSLGREIGSFFVGFVPPALVVAFFKTRYAPPNDLMAGQDLAALLSRLGDLTRYARVIGAFGKEILALGTGMVGVLAGYSFLVGASPQQSFRRDGAFALLVVALVLVAYALIYVTTPHDLSWHLSTSCERLVLQLWPVALFAFFLLAATPEEARARERRELPTPVPAKPSHPPSTAALA